MAKVWYIIQTCANLEKRVVESIKERTKLFKLEDLFDEIIVPSEQVTEIRRGQKVKAERRFFPGYVLIKMDMTDESYHLVRDTPRVSGFLGAEHGKKPEPLSEEEVSLILNQVENGAASSKPAVAFEVGEQVKVCDGPFASFYGSVEEIDHERSKLKVAVSIFGRATPVDLEYHQVEKVS